MAFAAGATGNDPTALIQFGVLGVILMLILFGFLWAKPSVDRILVDKDRAEKQRDELIDLYHQQIVPLLVETKDKTLPLMTELSHTMVEVRDELRQLSGEVAHERPTDPPPARRR